jgi:hypothetical protein
MHAMQRRIFSFCFAATYGQVRDVASVAAWSLQDHVVSTLVYITPGALVR